MERLWGEVRPVPPTALEVLQGGERIRPAAGSRCGIHAGTRVASRQLFQRGTGVAFVGDTAGVRLQPGGS